MEDPEPYGEEDVKVNVGLLRLPKPMLDAIDDYWHEARHPNRMVAVRTLIAVGLEIVKGEA